MIVWDFIRYAREELNIPVGPGRGSAAGSLVALLHGDHRRRSFAERAALRALPEPERISMPDIDIDLCMNRRQEVIEYVRRKYGTDQVAQIITFNTNCRQGRHQGRRSRARHALRRSRSHRQDDSADPRHHPSTRRCRTKVHSHRPTNPTQGQGGHRTPRCASKASFAVPACMLPAWSSRPSRSPELVPVSRAKNDDIVTSYDMGAVEKMGLLKMDFLGLTTLTVIDDCLKLIKRTTGPGDRHGHHRARRCQDLQSRSSTRRLPPASSSSNPAACATSSAGTNPTQSRTSPRSTRSIARDRFRAA